MQKIEKSSEHGTPEIGIITALPMEYAAVKVLLENPIDSVIPGTSAGRRYLVGNVPATNDGKHTIALSLADMGNNIAGTRATLLLEHFPSINFIIMVGIAGGVPYSDKPDEHVRLGDVVVSDRRGIVQYDFDKETIAEIIHRHPPRPPSATLLEGVKYLEADEIVGNRPWLKLISQALDKLGFIRPPERTDILASSADQTLIISHPNDPIRVAGQPRVFLAPIASANTLLKNPIKRDELRNSFGVKAIEMEGSGIADATWNHEVGYLVVRGICDYCDSHKGDEWQNYAAVAAAGYAIALLTSMPDQSRHSESIEKNKASHTSNTPRILVVEDEQAPRRIIEKTLEREGYSVRTAANAEQALQEIDQHSFDLIILDIRMPDLTGKLNKEAGLHALQSIRDKGLKLPIIILSASQNVRLAIEAMKYGASDYFVKGDFDPKDLLKKIREYLHID